jgi:hypothetical protein
MELLTLIATCAPLAAPDMMLALVEAESGGHPYAIHDGERLHRPETRTEAIALARRLTEQGRAIRAGLAQMSSREWTDYGLALESVFDPCQNLQAGERALLEGYLEAPERFRASRLAATATEQTEPAVHTPEISKHAESPAPEPGAARATPAWTFVPVVDGFGRAN